MYNISDLSYIFFFRYFATVFRHSNDFTEVDKFDENPNGKMITLTIEFSASDVSGNDCISEARDALGDLTPKSVIRCLVCLQ